MFQRTIFFMLCVFFSIPGFAIVEVDMSNYKNLITLTGSVTVSDFSFYNACGNQTGCSGGQHREGPLTRIAVVSGDGKKIFLDYINNNYPTCNRHYPNRPIDWTDNEKKTFTEWANSYLSTSPVYFIYRGFAPSEIQSYQLIAVYFRCKSPQTGVALHVQMYPKAGEITNPPPLVGSCTLNSQNLNLTYSSASLNVNGLTQSTNLNILCSGGNAKDYELKLTGSNVTNGRLNFGNGVSAQISLNGTQVQANSSGIQLNALTSRSISVSATLVGAASNSGTTSANGILILNAL